MYNIAKKLDYQGTGARGDGSFCHGKILAFIILFSGIHDRKNRLCMTFLALDSYRTLT